MRKQMLLDNASNSRNDRESITTEVLSINSIARDVNFIDFVEQVESAMEGLSPFERMTARLNLSVKRFSDGDWCENVAVVKVLYRRDETELEIEQRLLADADRKAVNRSINKARDRVEYARLCKLFAEKDQPPADMVA